MLVDFLDLVAGTTTTKVLRLVLDWSNCSLWNIVLIAGATAYGRFAVNVASASAPGRVRAITLIADWSFASDLSVDVGSIVRSDVGGTLRGMSAP